MVNFSKPPSSQMGEGDVLYDVSDDDWWGLYWLEGMIRAIFSLLMVGDRIFGVAEHAPA